MRNRDHWFGYCRRDRIRCLVGLSGCAVEGWEDGCACGVGSDLTACDYVALASVGILVASLPAWAAAQVNGTSSSFAHAFQASQLF